ncbi:serine/threonine-protein kinase 17A-like [Brevipalpus obovatus]|uniref:serine/threonine-protein kinase 17A-like n=1 Tax=Brevipalpus obovatus TaxID=246614 RepID=UPI003D9F240C
MGPMVAESDTCPKGFLCEKSYLESIVIRTEPLDSVYEVDPRPFARGKFAQVKRCRHKQTEIEYAGKAIKKRRRSSDVRHEIMHEIGVLLLAQNNEGIVKLHEVFETPTEFILILEMVKGGELQRVLDEEECVQEKDVIRLMRQILRAVEFLHSNNIAHLDIKPQNLLLTGPLPDGDVKLCDFGISRLIADGVELREILGTPDYVAPEILHFEAIRLETDMWSVGVLAYVLLTGYSPFRGDTKQETYSNITNGKVEFGAEFGNISASAIDFIKKTLVIDPKQRPSAKECLEHDWLKEEEKLSPNDESPVLEENFKFISTTATIKTESKRRRMNHFMVEESQNHLRIQVI